MSDPTPPEEALRRRGSGARLVYEALRDEIVDLRLAPGSPLDEVQLAERFQVSRTPVREALVRLSGEGLVSTLPNRSTIVSPIEVAGLGAFFDALVLMYRVTTRLAALHRSEADLSAIRARQAAFESAVAARDALGMIATNAAFHAAVAEAGRNPYFAQLFGRLLDEGRRILRLYYESYGDALPRERVEEHAAIVEALAGGDADEADRLAGEHAEGIVDHIRQCLGRRSDLDISL